MKPFVKNNPGKTSFSLYQETSVNQRFSEGQTLSFYSELLHSSLQGILLKKYTNSCLIDISGCHELTIASREKYNSRLVINYKMIFEDM
ncbi:DUF2187 domain-containing protein [Enterococcus sp. BWR-S5]|uniref:DUF2187 domain-containing protein n=1 Tax=Enterococcus sp. BWR-S5 TaxID=2787714 RepID=UPI001921B31D|nr:DUF2187 domain-containing protein [Enterococcus sp. BWR-S5]MBL1223649.1 DUF2187 domain-containing protein [Enterococcus sp. BWR-S5]